MYSMPRNHQLTHREMEVLLLVAYGRTDLQIAHQLGIGRRTASRHVSVILEKLNGATRTEATRIALSVGLIRFDQTKGLFEFIGGA